MTSRSTIDAQRADDECEAFRFELEASEADRLGYSAKFWRDVRRELRRNKRQVRYLRVRMWAHNSIRKVANKWL